MEQEREKGLVRSNGPKFGFIRPPEGPDRIFRLTDAPPGLKKWSRVSYMVKPEPNEPHDWAVDIRLMEVA